MDLADLLLILVFVVLPLLQQLLQRRTGGEADGDEGIPMDTGSGEEAPLPELEAEARTPIPDEWWRGPFDEAEAAGTLAERPVVDEKEAMELRDLQDRLPREVLPEAVRVSAPVVSFESLYVERPGRSGRPSQRDPSRPAPRRRRAAPRLRGLLDGPEDLRRAVLLSEVLGPPKGLE